MKKKIPWPEIEKLLEAHRRPFKIKPNTSHGFTVEIWASEKAKREGGKPVELLSLAESGPAKGSALFRSDHFAEALLDLGFRPDKTFEEKYQLQQSSERYRTEHPSPWAWPGDPREPPPPDSRLDPPPDPRMDPPPDPRVNPPRDPHSDPPRDPHNPEPSRPTKPLPEPPRRKKPLPPRPPGGGHGGKKL